MFLIFAGVFQFFCRKNWDNTLRSGLLQPPKTLLIVVTDSQHRFKRLDILIANYKWELEGFRLMDSPHTGSIRPYPKPYLIGMKLMAGGAMDEEDIRNLFLAMSDSEKEKAFEVARLIRRDRNLSKILAERRRRGNR